MEYQRIGVGPASGAERAGDRGGDPAAHGARRHHLHQHQHGKDERDAGQRIGPELGDEIGLDEPDRGLHEHHQDVGRGEPQQRSEDGSLEQQAGSRVEARRRRPRSDDVGRGSDHAIVARRQRSVGLSVHALVLRGPYWAIIPPSTVRIVPVVHDASSAAR